MSNGIGKSVYRKRDKIDELFFQGEFCCAITPTSMPKFSAVLRVENKKDLDLQNQFH